MRKYEGMFIIKPDISQGDQDKAIDSIKKSIAKDGGKIALSENWGKRRLAYAIKGYSEGVYHRFEFEIEPNFISVLKRDCKLNEDIIRELIIVKE